jgi:uncharacterized surface protein with fasciclin (FAS1) repeats
MKIIHYTLKENNDLWSINSILNSTVAEWLQKQNEYYLTKGISHHIVIHNIMTVEDEDEEKMTDLLLNCCIRINNDNI